MIIGTMQVDHLVHGVLDLDEGVTSLERRLGVRAVAGGRHLGRGTHNALLGLGGGSYLEVIAPDPEQVRPAGPLPFGLDQLTEPGLVAWAIRVGDIDAFVEEARRAGYDPGPVRDRSRARPDGVLLEWRLTEASPAGPGFPVPFLIDWLEAPHPAATAPGGVRLLELRARHPDPEAVRRALRVLDVEIPVEYAPLRGLLAVLDTPLGRVTL